MSRSTLYEIIMHIQYYMDKHNMYSNTIVVQPNHLVATVFISNVRFRSVEIEQTGDAEKEDRGRETLYGRTSSGMETCIIDTMSLGTRTRHTSAVHSFGEHSASTFPSFLHPHTNTLQHYNFYSRQTTCTK